MARFVNTPDGRVEWIHHMIGLAREFHRPDYPEGCGDFEKRVFFEWICDDIRIRPGCSDVTLEWVTKIANEFFENERKEKNEKRNRN